MGRGAPRVGEGIELFFSTILDFCGTCALFLFRLRLSIFYFLLFGWLCRFLCFIVKLMTLDRVVVLSQLD